MSARTYKDAIDCLNTLQSNAATLYAIRTSGGKDAELAMYETEEYLARIGYSPQDLNKLNVLHVTGTKGKGSTCAFADSLLRHAMPQWTVGLYTSPHLVAVRERIRINGKPISEEDFARFFFDVWDRLEKNDTHNQRRYSSTLPKPMYFRMITLVAFHAFYTLQVDATVLEVGVGGMYDCTNIVPKPIVTGISALGIDHVFVLGNTLKEIAWQKGGIYKEGVPAMSVNQPPEGLQMLEQQARDRKASKFIVVPVSPGLSSIKLGLAGSHQYQNANLAIHMVQEFLRSQLESVTPSTISLAFEEGLRAARWPGRCQTVTDPRKASTTWYLDGAHTLDSLDCCIQWFISPGVSLKDNGKKPTRVLVFNCTKDRSATSFLGNILTKASAQLQLHGQNEFDAKTFFDHVIFCTNITYADGGFKGDLTNRVVAESEDDPLRLQRQMGEVWLSLAPGFPPSNIHALPSIEHSFNVIKDIEGSVGDVSPLDVLVTGSLHLVGGMIEVAGLSEVAL